MGFMLDALSAAGACFAPIIALYPDCSSQAERGTETLLGEGTLPGKNTGPGQQAGMNPAAMDFGPPGQDAEQKPH